MGEQYTIRNINIDKLADHIRSTGRLDETPSLHLLDTIRVMRHAIEALTEQNAQLRSGMEYWMKAQAFAEDQYLKQVAYTNELITKHSTFQLEAADMIEKLITSECAVREENRTLVRQVGEWREAAEGKRISFDDWYETYQRDGGELMLFNTIDLEAAFDAGRKQ